MKRWKEKYPNLGQATLDRWSKEDLKDEEPYYTIKFNDGQERQTIRSNIEDIKKHNIKFPPNFKISNTSVKSDYKIKFPPGFESSKKTFKNDNLKKSSPRLELSSTTEYIAPIDDKKKVSYTPEFVRLSKVDREVGTKYRDVKNIVKGWNSGEEILTYFDYLTSEWGNSSRTHILTTLGREVEYDTHREWKKDYPQLEGEPIELSEEYMKIAEKYPKSLGVRPQTEATHFFTNILNIFREYHK